MPKLLLPMVFVTTGCSLMLTPLERDLAGHDGGHADADLDGDGDAGRDVELGDDGDAPDGNAPDGDAPDGDGSYDDTACDDRFASALFCDGFETGSLASWWEDFSENGAIEVVSDLTCRGVGALRAQSLVTGGHAAAVTLGLGGVTTGELYVRAYLYIPSTFSVSGLSLVIVGEAADPWNHLGFEITSDGRSKIWFNEDQVQHMGDMLIPRDRWFCMQLGIVIANTNGEVQCSIDGESAMVVGGRDTLPTAGYGLLNVGVAFAISTQLPATVFVDEVVVDTRPIPCDGR